MPVEAVLIFFQILVLVFAFSLHECAHAWAAWRLGDPTARMLGRVTLNPMKHLDPIGSVLMPIVAIVYSLPLIGWAKPCPVTPRNFKHYRRDDILTTLAGPASNLAVALVSLALLLIWKHVSPNGGRAIDIAMHLGWHDVGAPTDGLPAIFPLALLLYFAIIINLSLFVFNLIPLPPLDGSRILRHFLPYRLVQIYDRMGMFSLVLLFLVGGHLLNTFFYPLLEAFDSALRTI